MLGGLSSHQASWDVQSGESTLFPEEGNTNVKQLASLSSYTCGWNFHLPQSYILYLNKPLSKHAVFLYLDTSGPLLELEL